MRSGTPSAGLDASCRGEPSASATSPRRAGAAARGDVLEVVGSSTPPGRRARRRRAGSGACSTSTSRWSPGAKPVGLARLRRRLSTTSRRAVGPDERVGAGSGTSRCGMHAGEPRPRAEHHPVGVADRRRPPPGRPAGRAAAARRTATVAGVGRDRDLAADRGDARRGRRVEAATSAVDVERGRRPSAAPGPARRAAAPTRSRPATGSPSSSQRPTISRLPTAWPAQRRRSPREPVLEHARARSGPTRRRRRARPAPSAGRPGGSTPNSRAQPAATSRRRRRP